jgi:hypothetical protein
MKINIISIIYSIVVTTILFVVIITTIGNNVFAQSYNLDDYLHDDFYTNYNGKILSKDIMKERINYCIEMKNKNLVELTVNCIDWSLTGEGEQKITDYILEKNDIDSSEEKLDFWLKQLD